MNCNQTQRRLDALLEETLPAGERALLQSHVQECDDCREILTLLRLGDRPAPDLAAAILAQTVGDRCEQSRGLLCDLIDLRLEPIDRSLMASHLENCRECDGLSDALLRFKIDLPAMAELEVPSDLTAAILGATSGAVDARSGLADRVRDWAERLWNRPRLAWEAGYVGAMLMWILVSVSGTDLQASLPNPARTTGLSVQQWRESASHLGYWAWDWTERRSTTAIGLLREDLEPTIGKLGGSVEQTFRQLSGEARRTWTRLTANEDATEGE